MRNSNSFYVLYPEEKRVRDFLNSIKLLCDHKQRTDAHITVRGPYKIKLGEDLIESQNHIIKHERLLISEVENFFAFSNQNTVFFKCADNENLKKIWKKLTYNDFRPHITMYDGKDYKLAQQIFLILSKNFKPFGYFVKELSYLAPKTKDPLGLYSLKSSFDYSLYEEILGKKINSESITKMTPIKKLETLDALSFKIFRELSSLHYS